MTTHRQHLRNPHPLLTAERIGAVSWGAVFIWIGVALATSVGFAVTLIGLGLITLAAQGLRVIADLEVEGFWLVAGGFFLAGGLWPVVGLGVPFVPVALMAIGVLIVAGGLGKKHDRTGHVL